MPTIEQPSWALVCDLGALVSEVPVWHAREQALYWIDIYGPALNRTDPYTSKTKRWPLPERVGSFGLRAGGALLALKTGLHDLEFITGALTKRFDAPYDPAQFHFNDGRCDGHGRFWVGTSHGPNSQTNSQGRFYRVDAHGIEPMIDGITVANGIAFSRDQKTLYVAETRDSIVHAYDYDVEAGEVSNPRVFAQLEAIDRPDGAAIDSEGGYWTASIGAGRLLRFHPDGTLDRIVRTPTLFPTMIAFGGEQLATAFITSSAKYLDRLSNEERATEAHAGGIWRCDLGARGIPEPMLSF